MGFKCIRQTDLISCGTTCIRMLCRFHGREIPLEVIDDHVGQTGIGVSVRDLHEGLIDMNFQSVVVKCSIHKLPKLPLPLILYWRHNHFVVLYSIKKNHYYIADPAAGKIRFNERDFILNWGEEGNEGTAILALPTEEFGRTEYPAGSSSWRKVFYEVFKRTVRSKARILLVLFLILLSSICNWYIPLIYKNLIDNGVLAGNFHVVATLFAAQLSFFLGYLLFTNISSILLLKTNSAVTIEYLGSLLRKIIKLPLNFFDQTLHTEMIKRFEDFNRLQRFITDSLISEFFSIVSLIVFSVLLAAYDYVAVVIFYLISLMAIYVNIRYLNERKYLDYTRFAHSGRNFNNILEMLQGMRDLKIHGSEGLYVSKWEKNQDEINDLALKGSRLEFKQKMAFSFLNKLRDICVIGYCSFIAIDGDMSVGALISATYLMGMMSSPMEDLSGFFKDFQDARISSERISSIKSKNDERSGSKVPVFEKAIQFDDVSFKYPGLRSHPVLSSLSFEIPKGKVTAVVGSSGCGKTTLLKLALGFYDPSEGRILIDTDDMSDVDIKEWRSKCGIVFQDGFIFSGSIIENITMTKDVDWNKLDSACRSSCIHEFSNRLPLKLNTPIGYSGVSLSQGQKQRILIARALYKNPEILFFDEATSSLDATNESRIMKNIFDSCKGKTVVICAHRLSTVKKADRIIVLEGGKAVESGTHNELLLKKGAYYKLVRDQLDTVS